MTWPEIASFTKDIVLAIAAVVASICAIIGLFAWKRELQGKTKYLAAHGMLKSTYTLREAVKIVRNPFIDILEFPPEYKSYGKSQNPIDEASAYSHVYTERWKYVAECIGDFDASVLEAEAIWGKEIKDAADDYRIQLNYLQTAIQQFIRNKQSRGLEARANPEHQRRIESIVWSENVMNNSEYSDAFLEKITKIESVLLPHLGRN